MGRNMTRDAGLGYAAAGKAADPGMRTRSSPPG